MARIERGRELIDVTQQEFFVGLERKFFSYETSDELIKKRYLTDFMRGSVPKGYLFLTFL